MFEEVTYKVSYMENLRCNSSQVAYLKGEFKKATVL